MQKFVSKYALAAHLSLLTAAPLLLLPFFARSSVAQVVLWLSLACAVWMLMCPSIRPDELAHDARQRVLKGMLRDPLFWTGLVLVAFSAVRWLNGGVETVYDAELGDWRISDPAFAFLPASAKGEGFLEFACSVAFVVIAQSCRHALGRKARAFFLSSLVLLAGVAALAYVVCWACGLQWAESLAECSRTEPSFAGTVFAVYYIAAVFALASAFELDWGKPALVMSIAMCGILAAAFVFSPSSTLAVFAIALFVSFAVLAVYVIRRVSASSALKFMLAIGVSVVLPTLFIMEFADPALASAKVAGFTGGGFFPKEFFAQRSLLSSLSFKIWQKNLWLGSGLGAFPLELRFAASPADWKVLATSQMSPMSGWWMLAVERGIVGSVMLATVFGFLVWTWSARLVGAVISEFSPDGRSFKSMVHPLCALPLATIALVVACAFTDGSCWRADMLLPLAAFLAVGANAIRKRKRSPKGEK